MNIKVFNTLIKITYNLDYIDEESLGNKIDSLTLSDLPLQINIDEEKVYIKSSTIQILEPRKKILKIELDTK